MGVTTAPTNGNSIPSTSAPDRLHVPGLRPPPPPPSYGRAPLVRSLARDAFGREIPDAAGPPADSASQTPAPASPPAKRELATDALGRRVGNLVDEVDFPAFVASLVHGTFDAIVDASIRQMESFADLVAAVAKPLEQFTQENVTPNQARDYLVEQYPRDVALNHESGTPTLVPIARTAGPDGEAEAPRVLADYGLEGQELTSEVLEQQILAHARETVAKQRLQTLSTMVLLGMNRVVVKDGSINANVRFRASAADHKKFDYATGSDPQSNATQWGARGSTTYDAPTTKVSTMGVNVQADSELKAQLFGEVKINFASETVPLDRFVDDAKRGQLERHARGPQRAATPPIAPTQPPSAVATLPPPVVIASAPPPAPAGATR